MKLFPVIDVKNGYCVRLRQGQFQDIEVYSHFPVKIAKNWEQLGASFIHIVDLDGALVGHSVNGDIIKEIVSAVSIPVQVGGGVRTIMDIENLLNLGVTRVVIGTKAVENPAFVREAINAFGVDKILVAIDAKNGMVAIEGWEKMSTYNAVSLAKKMKEYGVKTIVYTDILKDGMMQGPNVEHTKEMVESTGLDIIVSGGISSLKDLEMINEVKAYGALMGKALYENKLDLKNAIELFEKGDLN